MGRILSVTSEAKFTDMFRGEELAQITYGMQNAIEASFDKQFMRNPTRTEVRHRFDILFGWARTLRGDLKWSLPRIVNEFGKILEAELSGQKYQPNEKRTSWVVDANGNAV